jgi:hypothetical protein
MLITIAASVLGQGYGPTLEVVDGGGKVRLGLQKDAVMGMLADCCDVIPGGASQPGTFMVKWRSLKEWKNFGLVRFDSSSGRLVYAQRQIGQFDSGDSPFDLAQALYFSIENLTREQNLIGAAAESNRSAGVPVNDSVDFSREPGKILRVALLSATADGGSPIRTVLIYEEISRDLYLQGGGGKGIRK